MNWFICYDDGSFYTSDDGPFKGAPSDGVLGVVVPDEQVGYEIYYGKDYYYELPDGTIAMTDDLGPFLRLLGIVKFGRWTGKKPWGEAFERMVARAREEWPRKSGTKQHEGEPIDG